MSKAPPLVPASNTPFQVHYRQTNSGPSPPMGFLGYQCESGAPGGCRAVNQFDYAPGAATFFSAQHCVESCGCLAPNVYRSPSLFALV